MLLFFPSLCFSQAPGNAIVLSGTGQYVNFGEVLGGVRTISFWIKPSIAINSSLSAEQPVLVRDNGGPSTYDAGEVAIYFGKSGSSEAGRLVFIRGVQSQAFKILSDSSNWSAGRWYHIAAVIHEQDGMQLYVNGVLQQDSNSSTDAIYMRAIGNTGPVYLGRWGAVTTHGIFAQFDELRFYNFGLSEFEVRSKMCKVEGSTSLKGYFNFDAATAQFIPTNSGFITGQGVGLAATSFVGSNAPVGTESVFIYNLNAASSLTITNQASFIIDNISSSSAGLHLYTTEDAALGISGFLPRFYGVWFTSSNAQYRAQMDFSAMGLPCDSCSEIRSREFQTIQTWTDRQVVADTCVFVLPNESPGTRNYREEYVVKPELEIVTGLDDTIVACDSAKVQLAPAFIPGARYFWENGSRNRTRVVDSAGLYTVTVKWHGCEVTKNVRLIYQYRPYFNLPPDTAICIGDTFVIKAPLDIDSATYSWAGGLHFGRNFRMHYAGTISLKITVGNCSWEDWITVDVIKPFQLNLGKDTTLCLGEELVLSAPSGVQYLWSDGSTGRQKRVFNQSQKVWVNAWNDCFFYSDTISVEYEDCACYIYLANSFTPNNDGINDVYMPVSECIFKSFSLSIFDRWGKQVFYSNNINEGWNGQYNGKNLPEGVYSYKLDYEKYNGQSTTKSEYGTISLLY